MRYILFSLLVPFCLDSFSRTSLAAEFKSKSLDLSSLAFSPRESFYTTAGRLVQEHINLVARIEQAISSPDPNKVRAVRGQLSVQTHAVERFLFRQYNRPEALCKQVQDSANSPIIAEEWSQSQTKIYCSLYASNQDLLKLAPQLDVLLSRRGELALVRDLPLVSGERQSDPVLSISSVQRPNLAKPATPFSTQEPNLPTAPPPVVGRTAKKPLANYVPPMQPAITAPERAIAILEAARVHLANGIAAFPAGTKLYDPKETNAALERFTYDLDRQEPQTYAKLLDLPNTGIFRVLPYTAYLRPLNTLQNRLQKSVSERYPYPSLGKARGSFIPSLPLQIVADNFQLKANGVDYSFMVNLGDVPLEKLDAKLQAVTLKTRDFFLNYKPPKQLGALQVDRRRFITGQNQNWNQNKTILASAKVALNNTYLVRTIQFQLPEFILSGQPISQEQRRYLDQLLKTQGSDIILAFRPVRRRSDGSYTVLWRVLTELSEPQIEDLEKYVTPFGARR
ncbi:MAG: hypothetical protein SAK29_36275 [Scytonema sp. PMC 1069.18]|nr:hypothetical protein [Scytonema sp. PMC 1069.18]MEC4888242.1 hypothetical protein [Scytonema sp. PMC 1070.18]